MCCTNLKKWNPVLWSNQVSLGLEQSTVDSTVFPFEFSNHLKWNIDVFQVSVCWQECQCYWLDSSTRCGSLEQRITGVHGSSFWYVDLEDRPNCVACSKQECFTVFQMLICYINSSPVYINSSPEDYLTWAVMVDIKIFEPRLWQCPEQEILQGYYIRLSRDHLRDLFSVACPITICQPLV